MISRFVYETRNKDNTKVLFHSVTRKELNPKSDITTLRDNLFFDDQNLDAIKSRLFKPPENLEITFIPTWECNLRCNHCCVLHLLKKKEEHSHDLEKVENFLDRYYSKYKLKRLSCTLLGGEPLLYPEKVLPLIKICEQIEQKHSAKLFVSGTTNLAYNLTLDHIEVMNNMDFIAISLDGFIEHHNKQRFFLDKSENPFQKTVSNIHKLIKLGFTEKMFVQAAIKEEQLCPQYALDFTKFVISLGLKMEQVQVGSIFPTKYKPKPEITWLKHKNESLFVKQKPCCKYELMSRIQVHPDGSLWDNFYTQENSRLGTLDNTIEEIEVRNLDLIMNHMPCLNDQTCLSCPALGYCWGGCIAGQNVIDKKPSEMCSRHLLVPYMQQLAEEGRLTNYKEKYASP